MADTKPGVDERKYIEQALRNSEERYRLLFNNTNDPVLVHAIGKDGKPSNFIEVNEKACKTFGYTREELLTFYSLEQVHHVFFYKKNHYYIIRGFPDFSFYCHFVICFMALYR